jgi:hypothetical protein
MTQRRRVKPSAWLLAGHIMWHQTIQFEVGCAVYTNEIASGSKINFLEVNVAPNGTILELFSPIL